MLYSALFNSMAWIFVCCECRVLSGRGLCDELITRPEESYRLCCVVVCDLTSRMGAPYIYDISHLRVKLTKRLYNMCGVPIPRATRTHRATHHLLCSNSSPRKAFLSSPKHRNLRISLRVTFSCSLLWKWASRGPISQPWRTSNGMRRPNCRRFQKKPSTGASNNGTFDGASVCVRKGPTLKVIR